MKQEMQPFPQKGNLSSERGNPALPWAGRLHLNIKFETKYEVKIKIDPIGSYNFLADRQKNRD